MKARLVSILIAIILLTQLAPLAPFITAEAKPLENGEIPIRVGAPIDVKYISEPVVFPVYFSYGEAGSGSIRILDERGLEIPYQILEERFYEGTKYYSYAKILILTDVEKKLNRSYIVKYSSKPSEAPPYMPSDLKVWRTPAKNGTWDVIVENSYLRAVFKGNSSLGLYRLYNLESGLNESLVSPFWSFASPCVMVDGRWFTPLDMKRFNMSVTVNGSLMVEVVFSRPGLGKVLVGALKARDYTVLQSVVVVYAAFVVLFNLLTDLAIGVIDPRVKYD